MPEQPGMYRECPHCREMMRRDASVCPHCRRESKAWQFNQGRWWAQIEDGHWIYLDEKANRWVAFEQPKPMPAAVAQASSQPSAAGGVPAPTLPSNVPRKKGLWRGRSKWEKAAWVVLALIVVAVIAAAVSPSDNNSSSPSAADSGGTPVASGSSSDEVTGRVAGVFHRDCFFCGDLKRYVRTSNVWCGWSNDTLIVHVTMANDSVEHVTVNWHPSYIVQGGTEHGAGLTSEQSDGFDSGETRDLRAEQHPEGVTPGAAIAECKPSFSTIDSG